MIRVALPAIGGRAWMAGRIYLWNLLFALQSVEKRLIQPVVLHGRDFAPDELAGVRTEFHAIAGWLDRPRIKQLGRVAKYIAGRDVVIEQALRATRADVYSHGVPLGRRSPFAQISWIPDLQHRQLPELFGRTERLLRDIAYREVVRDADRVVVSSRAALDDLVALAGAEARDKVRVLHFVTQPRKDSGSGLDALRARHRLPERFFHLPNQFWKHKNHAVVVEALALARRDEPGIVMVATGSSEDYRNPTHYASLMARVTELNLERTFRHLGVVPFPDVMGLMEHSAAVINPSRFEGWSTTVEEAKSLGKSVLLSDIPVHREQAPERARYFAPNDAIALAVLLVETWRSHDPATDAAAAERAAAALPARTRTFGETYQELVAEVYHRRRSV